MQPDELLVNPDGGAARCEAQHEGLSSTVLLDDCILDDLGHRHRSLARCGEEVGGDLLDEGEAWELGKVAARFFDRHAFLKLQHPKHSLNIIISVETATSTGRPNGSNKEEGKSCRIILCYRIMLMMIEAVKQY